MSDHASPGAPTPSVSRIGVVSLLGITQIIAWGSTFYLPTVLAAPIARDTGWSSQVVFGGFSLALVVSGLAAPRIGRAIDRFGGRSVLVAGSALFAIGLAMLGEARHLWVYFAAWLLIGLGMAAGLYDAAFATLGRLFGLTARPLITGLTLFGGLASTVGWPVVAALEAGFGWRATCLVLAAVHLIIVLPLHLFLLPREPAAPPRLGETTPAADDNDGANGASPRLFLLIVAAFTAYSFISSGMSAHWLELFRRLGIETAAAVAIGMAIGPAQVGGRLIEFAFGQQVHPIWTARTGIALCLASLVLLAGGGAGLALLTAILYGAGNGIMTIARGTLPLAVFGAQGYGARIGRMARPMLIAQAIAPVALAVAIDNYGTPGLLGVVIVLAVISLVAFALVRPPRPGV